VKVHPNPAIDIAVVDISNFRQDPDVMTFSIQKSFFMSLAETQKYLTYGSHVFTIGYPQGLKNLKTNQPLVKSAFISSSLDGQLTMKQSWKNRNGQMRSTLTDGKIFIIDGMIIPGNSGGPVIMPQEVRWFMVNGQLKHSLPMYNFIIGIVSNIYANTGLTVVFSTDHIQEVIDEFPALSQK